jgi:hypothetical protein
MPPTPKALRKLKRAAENSAYALVARFWMNPKTAIRMGYDKPINRQAAQELNRKPSKKRKPSN